MQNILKNFANLIKVKTIVTVIILSVYVVMALRGEIPPENVDNVTLMVIAFYFGSQHEREN